LVVLVVLVVVLGFSGDALSQKKPTLPKGWSKLGLSAEQKTKVYEVLNKHRDKLDMLKKQLAEATQERDAELFKLLTVTQKDELRKLLLKGLPDDKDKSKSEK